MCGGHNGGFERLQPGRFGQESGNDVGEIEERRGEKHFLHRLVLALDHDQPDNDGANRDGVVLVEAEQFEAAGDAGKFRDHVAEVDDDQADHHEERDAKSKFLANQIAQALAGDRAHAGGDLLHHDQRHRDRDHGPEQHVSELGPGRGIGPDAAGIVVHVRGDETRPDDGEEDQKPDFPAFQEGHAAHTYRCSDRSA